MSLINKMLQDLDRRNAIQDTPDVKNLRKQVRAVGPTGIGSEWFWRLLAGLIFVALAWVGWVIWQLSPRPLVTDLAMQSPRPAKPAPPVAPAPAPVAQAPEPQPAAPPPAEATTPSQPQIAAPLPSAPPSAPAAAPPSPEKLKLATELATPPRAPAAAPAPVPKPAPQAKPVVPEPAKAPPKPAAQEVAKPPIAEAPKAAPARPAPPPAAAAAGKIDRRETATPRDQAEAEFRRGLAFVNQGRVSEGMEAFRTTLSHDPGHETARQTMVALLLESKRLDEASQVLREGLVVNPLNAQFAMLLARVMVQSGDAGGALATLDRHGAFGVNNPDQRAFRGALLQRLGRHSEAIDEYRASVNVNPGTAQWWVGLGISQQALAQPKDALESFRRARGAGNLTPELASFVDQRIRQLQ